MKLITNPATPTKPDELYDLRTDPKEQRNLALADAYSEHLAALHTSAKMFLVGGATDQSVDAAASSLPEAVREQLRTLGYLE